MPTTARQILQDTVDDIFADPRASVVCLVPILVSNALVFLFALAILRAVEGWELMSRDEIEQKLAQIPASDVIAIVLAVILLLVICLIGWLWTAVAWHRMIALGERQGLALPKWNGRKFLGYLGRVLLVGLILLLLAGLLFAAAALIVPEIVVDGQDGGVRIDTSAPVFDETRSVAAMIVLFALNSVIYGLYLCLSLILPAHAIDRPLSMGEAWEASRHDFLRLYLPLGILLAVVEFVFTFVAGLVSFGGVFDLIAFGIMTLVGIGVLTRLYMARFPVDEEPDPLTETVAE